MNPAPARPGDVHVPPLSHPGGHQVYGGGYAAATDSPSYMADPSQHGAHWLSAETDYSVGDDDVNATGGENDAGDGRDPKRRRIAKACDMCRKKKIKCDGKTPKCSHCENYKTECIFTHVEKKRAPPKGAKYIEGLENRLGRMERLLRQEGLLPDDSGRIDLGTLERRLEERRQTSSSVQASPALSSGGTQQGAEPKSPGNPSPPRQQEQRISPQTDRPAAATTAGKIARAERDPNGSLLEEANVLADQMDNLISNQCGETRYIGSSSGFSIFSPKGIKWVNEKTGDNSFQQMIANATVDERHSWDHWKPEVFNDLFQRPVFKSLPPKQECYALLKKFFERLNRLFPLFHEPTFMHLVERQYSLDPYESSGWWASLNVALALSHRLRLMSNIMSQDDDEHAWGYLKNAMAVMTELTMRNADLMSVQALLGMAIFLQGTSNPQPSFFLVAAGIRLAHSLGLHKSGSGFGLSESENEQRKRVFWIAYMMDKDLCLRSGRPPSQDDDDMNVELPSEHPPDKIGSVPVSAEQKAGDEESTKTWNIFRKMCMFGQIESRVYKQLYSAKASRQSDGELLNTIGELDSELEKWKDSIPLDFRPEHEIKVKDSPVLLHVVLLHITYYNCLTTVHRMSVHHGYWTNRLSDYAIQGLNSRPLNPRVFMSAALCVNAARTSIGLLRYFPQGDYACVWLVLYYPVSALVTLFANILQNPQDIRARSDLRLMSSVVSFLAMLERDVGDANVSVRRMLSVCREFERIATIVLDKAERDRTNRKGGKREGPSEQTADTERKEMEKVRRSRGAADGVVAAASETGSTQEQIRVGGQREHTQTPILPTKGTPGSQSHSTPGGSRVANHAEHYSHRRHGSFDVRQQELANNTRGPWSAQTTTAPFAPVDFDFRNGLTTEPSVQHPPPYSEPQEPLTDGFSTSFPLPNAPLSDTLMAGDMGPNHFDPGTGDAFQQPFVPQDLWQMPMTLEWDWAEGLGLGGLNSGPFDDIGRLHGTPGSDPNETSLPRQ